MMKYIQLSSSKYKEELYSHHNSSNTKSFIYMPDRKSETNCSTVKRYLSYFKYPNHQSGMDYLENNLDIISLRHQACLLLI